MTVTEVTSKRGKTADDRDASASFVSESRSPAKHRMRITIPFLITLAAVALAGLLGWAMLGVYMGPRGRATARCAPMWLRLHQRLRGASSSGRWSTINTFIRVIC